MHYELIKNNVRVVLHTETNEGYDGEYDSYDAEDSLLYRFDVERLVDGEWVAVDDASYCTRLTADLPQNIIQKALGYLMDQLYSLASEGSSIKKACEYLSWIRADWVK